MIMSSSKHYDFDGGAMSVAQSAVNNLLLELVALKNSSKGYSVDNKIVDRFYSLVPYLNEQVIAQSDRVSGLLKVIQESKFFTRYASKAKPEDFVTAIYQDIDMCIASLEELGVALRSKAWSSGEGARMSLRLLGA